jgi:secreted trypsin-like serine protease
MLQGDSGGPLFYLKQPHHHPLLIGILSFGQRNCGEKIDRPDVYVSVGYFRKWIDQTLVL